MYKHITTGPHLVTAPASVFLCCDFKFYLLKTLVLEEMVPWMRYLESPLEKKGVLGEHEAFCITLTITEK